MAFNDFVKKFQFEVIELGKGKGVLVKGTRRLCAPTSVERAKELLREEYEEYRDYYESR